MSQRNLIIVFAAIAVAYACYGRGAQNPYARYVADGFAVVQDSSLETVPNRELYAGAMEGMVGVLRRRGDPHSQFLPEEEANPLKTEIRQQFGGIGVRLGFDGEPPQLIIVGPPDPGGPAARANLLPRDKILEIDGQPTREMSMLDVVGHMRGTPGTKLELTIQHEHETEPKTLELVREVINIESILGDRRRDDGTWEFLLADDPQLAHVRIASFGERTVSELARVLERLRKEGAKGAVLDLRDNAGGSLDAAVAVCQLFLPADKLVLETRGRDGELIRRYTTTETGEFVDFPIVVLVNQNSASASEIVAACLQDHGRAAIVGERSYGKGTVQQLVPLESGRSLLKLTWASFWRPSGAQINRAPGGSDSEEWGVSPTPEHTLRLTPEQYAAFRKFRTDRDMFKSNEPAEKTDSTDSAAGESFADEQLKLAVDVLRQETSGKE